MQGLTIAGVTIACVLFIFVCVLFPRIVKNKSQFYMAFVGVALILLLETLGVLFGGKFENFTIVVVMFLVLGVFVVLVMATGGLSLKELTGEITNAIEVMRRGEDSEKEIIIPLSKDDQAKIHAGMSTRDRDEHEGRTTYVIDDPPPKTPPAPPEKKADNPSIPLE